MAAYIEFLRRRLMVISVCDQYLNGGWLDEQNQNRADAPSVCGVSANVLSCHPILQHNLSIFKLYRRCRRLQTVYRHVVPSMNECVRTLKFCRAEKRNDLKIHIPLSWKSAARADDDTYSTIPWHRVSLAGVRSVRVDVTSQDVEGTCLTAATSSTE